MQPSKADYLDNFLALLEDSYTILKLTGTMPEKRVGFIEGYMAAGKASGLATYKELAAVIEQANQSIFGLSFAERRRTFKEPRLSREEYLEIPAFLRQGKRF